MGTRKNRVFALLIAVVMVFTSAIGVFAADSKSPTQGAQPSTQDESSEMHTVVNYNSDSIDVPAGATVTVNGKAVAVKGNTASGIKKGALVVVKSANGKDVDYRWMRNTKITKAAKKKLVWKKAKGASYYLVKIMKKGKVRYKKVKGTKVKAKKLGLKTLKGAKFRVRPIKVVKGIPYAGGFSSTKKGKK